MNAPLNGIPILTYHKIDARREWGLTCVRPHRFREQMVFLKETGFHPVNFFQLQKNRLPKKPVIITFDDGYDSVYRHALPVLQELQFTAVVFVITGFIGGWNRWDANLGGIRFRHLDEPQIGALSGAGMEIGSHGITHRALTSLSAAEIETELSLSRKFLSGITGQAARSVAYPFGMQNAVVCRMARQAGYVYGCINLWGKLSAGSALALRRIPVYRTDSLSAFRRKLSSDWAHKAEITKLRTIGWWARLTPLYQKFTKNLSGHLMRASVAQK